MEFTEQSGSSDPYFAVREVFERVRDIENPVDIQEIALKYLGEALNADRAMFARANSKEIVIEACFASAGDEILGHVPIGAFDPIDSCIHAGRTVCVCSGLESEGSEQIGAGKNLSYITAIALQHQDDFFVCSIQCFRPREWSDAEAKMVEAIAARVWPIIQCARLKSGTNALDALLATITDLIPDMVWLLDSSGRLIFQNRAWRDYFRYSPAQAKTLDWITLVHPEDVSEARRAWAAGQESGFGFKFLLRLRRFDGVYSWFSGTALPCYIRGKVQYWLGTMQDVAELQADSASKDEVISLVAHELRGPLAPMHTGLTLLRTQLVDVQSQSILDMMERQVAGLERMVGDLFMVGKLRHRSFDIKAELLDLRTVLKESIETQAPFLERQGQTLNYKASDEAALISGDKLRLKQLFGNLIHNAGKFMFRGGIVDVSLKVREADILVTVLDHGVGMKPEALDRIFEMFRQESEGKNQSGLGIGLSLAREIAELHGGTVSASSPGPGLGSSFTVSLPRAGPGTQTGDPGAFLR